MEYVLFLFPLLGVLIAAGFVVVGTLAFAYFNPQERWVRHLIKGVVFVVLWIFMNSI